jgi:hypothetical protein
MARATIDNAAGSGAGTLQCGWKNNCQGHQTDVGYPKKGIMERKSLRGWTHPSAIVGIKQNKTKITDTTVNDYSYQRHHVIPVQAFNNLPTIKNNLELLGYNINLQDENGISLPFRPKDLVWHDLQFHRGSHPTYTSIVETRIRAIQGKCGKYCEKGEQSTLWDLIEKAVSDCRDEIKNWTLFIHPWAAAERPIQFSAWT